LFFVSLVIFETYNTFFVSFKNNPSICDAGIGFKSVFLVSRSPYIFSSGYQIKFSEDPCAECGIGYIVPEWVEDNPSISDIVKIYSSFKTLPTTTFILPLKNDKIDAVKKELSNTHPEVLLFLSKIRELSVREVNDDLNATSLSQISISSEADALTRKDIGAESYTLHLSADEDKRDEQHCSYYIWKQHFPVKPECHVQKREGIDQWVVMLAFPHGQRLSKGVRSPGVYAFLPTEMATNFPFIIQADFLLSSSRESILLDSQWNQGILQCVPSAFVNAFLALVKSTESAPVFALPPVFKFLPLNHSTIELMDSVRLSIRNKLIEVDIIPCETCSSVKVFCKPTEVFRLNSSFWSIINRAVKLGIDVHNISSHGTNILNSYFDIEAYDDVLGFLRIGYVESEWYGRCIQGSELVKLLPEDIYFDLLSFVAENWQAKFVSTNMMRTPLVRCVGGGGAMTYRSVCEATTADERLCMLSDEECAPLIINWNNDYFSRVSRTLFMPLSTQKALGLFSKKTTVVEWLEKYVAVKTLTLHEYALIVVKGLTEKSLVLAFTRFIHHLHSEKLMPEWSVKQICNSMPLVDNSGHVVVTRSIVLVPSKGSKWGALLGENPWRPQNYVELGDDYVGSGNSSGEHIHEDQYLSFIRTYIHATDLPLLIPPDASFPAASSSLTAETAVLLLEWIRNLMSRGVGLPKKFLSCIMHGNWLMTSVGYRSPADSFMSNEEWGYLFQTRLAFVDVPMIDQEYYMGEMNDFKEVLATLGVKFEFSEAMSYIGKSFISMVTSTLTGEMVLSLLRFFRLLKQEDMLSDHLIGTIKGGDWLKTCSGYRSPTGSVLFSSEWIIPSEISCLPFVDTDFYGHEISEYKSELQLLGVHGTPKQNYQIIVDNINLPTGPVNSDAAILLLKCIRHAESCKHLVKRLKKRQWLKTNAGFRAPWETFLLDPEWKCLVEFADVVPLLDLTFYGNEILTYRAELMKLGVVGSLEQASNSIVYYLKQLLSTSSLTKEIRLALLSCYKDLSDEYKTVPANILNFMRTEKWLHTTQGFRTPNKCVLSDSSWESVTAVASLPFIDDSDSSSGTGKEIYNYKKELKALGVTVDFNQGADLVLSCLSTVVGPQIPNPNVSSALTNAERPPVLMSKTLVSLLKCIHRSSNPRSFALQISQMQMKSTLGYRNADQCILYDSAWSSYLCREDGPFIDEAFYGPEILSYRTEFRLIGVVVDVGYGCSLLAQDLKNFSKGDTITRIYKYLAAFKWEPRNKGETWIWIPKGRSTGNWERPADCVLHDWNGLFSTRFSVLDKYYQKDLQGFFANVLGVRHSPRVLDHCILWRSWECTSFELTPASCTFFWEFIGTRWSATTAKLLSGSVTRVPVLRGGKIILREVEDVFVPDDFLLKHLFDQFSSEPIFVWYPSGLSFRSRAQMDSIYQSLGVRAISKAVTKDETCMLNMNSCQVVEIKDAMITPGLLRIILAFLANPALGIDTDKRHQMASYLLSVKAFEMTEPICVSYQVKLSLGRTVTVKGRRLFRWERENHKLYMQNSEGSHGRTTRMEFATCFGEEISQGLLYERVDLVQSLTELLKVGFLIGFEEDEVEFLLKTKNLQLFVEDEDFLLGAFPHQENKVRLC
jgi:sacsin